MRTNDVEYVVSEICASEKIISSSLHGIIIAESYGVPAVFLQDREDALNFKYEDWYESTCRDVYPIAHNFDEACRIKSEVPSNIKDLQKTLIDTFPIDLYENNKLPEIKKAMFDLLDCVKGLS
jgi:pyruvyltransferase